MRLKDFWGDAAIGIFKKLSARKCPKIRFFLFFNSYLMILNISAAEFNRNNMRNSSELKTANFGSSFRLFLCTLLDLCVSSFRLSARLNKLLVSFNELPITFNELAEIGRN